VQIQSISALAIGVLLAFTVEARGPWRASEANTRGWQLMTPEERIEHQSRIRGFATLEECRSYQLSHHQLMEERAKQHGIGPCPAAAGISANTSSRARRPTETGLIKAQAIHVHPAFSVDPAC
jgi:hypothetical protein